MSDGLCLESYVLDLGANVNSLQSWLLVAGSTLLIRNFPASNLP